MPKSADRLHADALNARRRGDVPKRYDKDPVTLADGSTDKARIGKLLSNFRNLGRKTLEPGLREALARHGLEPYHDGEKWRLPLAKPTPIRWTDEQYATGLNGRTKGDLPKRDDKDPVALADGSTVPVPTGMLRITLQSHGRVTMEPVLRAAFARHGLTPYQDAGGRWWLPKVKGRSAVGAAAGVVRDAMPSGPAGFPQPSGHDPDRAGLDTDVSAEDVELFLQRSQAGDVGLGDWDLGPAAGAVPSGLDTDVSAEDVQLFFQRSQAGDVGLGDWDLGPAADAASAVPS
ncbi:hypothetical protein, partial [Streptomyces sp. NPDC048277]|uniref:hypothetical protein n=1 Tax=Streptomyces sp. NPDC048277 TaxID=3155027 RepID=UPI00340CFC51